MNSDPVHIPVTILTGFLGAGKTTFLNHLIQKNPAVRYAVIDNEFGEQGVDNELIIMSDETIVELNNGCLCCTLNDNLYDILNELFDRRDEFDEIIIEATGVADPAGLAEPFISHPLVKKHFPLQAIVCLADAELIEDYLEDTEEAKQQIAFSDIILINKSDLVNPNYLTSLTSTLALINPLALIEVGNKDSFPEIKLVRSNEDLEKSLHSGHHHHEEDLSFPIHKTHSHHHHHTKEINSELFIIKEPFSLSKLNLNLSVYLTFQSSDLYRIKGVIWLENQEKKYVLQSVGKRFDLTEHKVWKDDEPRESRIVFIGKNIQRKGISKLLSNSLSQLVS